MLDKFLEVAYTRTKEAEDKTRLVESMRKLPNELLMKIASGEEKLAFMGHGGESWLDKFKGSPLFGQAIQLEEQQLQLDMSNKQQWAAESAKRTQDDAVRDELCVKKKMLGLELAKQQEAQLQHEMTETPEDEAMESPQQQAMEQAQGMEMHPAPVAAAKMAEYLGKVGFAVTQKGHEYDAVRYEMLARHGAEGQALSDQYGGGRFGLTDEAKAHVDATSKAPKNRGAMKRLIDLARFGGASDMSARSHADAAAKHSKGENRYNPFGGLFTPTKHEVGGTKNFLGAYKTDAPELKEVTASARMKLAAAGYSVDQIDQMEKEALGIMGAVKGVFNSAKAGWGGAGAARAAAKSGFSGAATNVGKYWQGVAKTRPGLAAGMVAAPVLAGGAMLGRATAPAQQPPPR